MDALFGGLIWISPYSVSGRTLDSWYGGYTSALWSLMTHTNMVESDFTSYKDRSIIKLMIPTSDQHQPNFFEQLGKSYL